MDFTTNEALTDLFCKYKDMVYRIAMNKMHDNSLADEISQQVFIKLVSYAHTLETEEHVKHWLIRTTQTTGNDYYSKPENKNSVSYEDELAKGDYEDGANSMHQFSLPQLRRAADPADRVIIREMVYEAVRKLPDALRSAIHLYYYEELKVSEIANALGISEGSVKTRMSRARNMLKESLADLFD